MKKEKEDREMELKYRKAVKDDAQLLITIYNAAFYDDYIRYGTCPGYGKTMGEMEVSIETIPKFIIFHGNEPVGVISVEKQRERTYYIGCLCVVPQYQGKGIGTQAFRYALSICPDWNKITLKTPVDKVENVRFYTEKCGFSIGSKERDGTVEIVHFYMVR